MNYFITLWFSSLTLLSPATQYSYVPTNVGALIWYKHTYSVFNDTVPVCAHIESLAELEAETSKKRIFKGPEQTLLTSQGKPVLLTTKFLAKPQYVVLSYDRSLATHSVIGSPLNPINREEFYTISASSTDIVNYTLEKAKQTGYDYKIYKSQEYTIKDNGHSFTFKKLP